MPAKTSNRRVCNVLKIGVISFIILMLWNCLLLLKPRSTLQRIWGQWQLCVDVWEFVSETSKNLWKNCANFSCGVLERFLSIPYTRNVTNLQVMPKIN